jgi:adenylate cyclase
LIHVSAAARRLPPGLAARLDLVGGLGNGLGGVVVVGFLLFVLPTTPNRGEIDELTRRSVVLFAIFAPIALTTGRELIGRRPLRRITRWLREGRVATAEERHRVLRYPLNWALQSFGVWVFGATLAVIVNGSVDLGAAIVGGVTVVLGGFTACSLQYLLVERIMRPVTARALAGGPPPRGTVPGVRARVTMAWMLATGVPVLGIAAMAAWGLAGAEYDFDALVRATLFLAAVALCIGLAATLFAAGSVADPLESMRGALARVEAGELEAAVEVDDGSEVGLLQAGFNRMAHGIAERERLREAFGTFVDPSLAERVMHEGTDLAGEEVEVSLLFTDIRGFTTFSERAEAREVVRTLNDLYGEVVPVILRRGGHANKFIGDGLLAVFGAPERLDDHADRATAAGLEIAHLVERRFGDRLRVGIGVNSGPVIVGTIGGGGRLDFTVIGDPVNTAARVEAATRQTGDDVLITDATRSRLRSDLGTWTERPAIALKGKAEEVKLFAPTGLRQAASR